MHYTIHIVDQSQTSILIHICSVSLIRLFGFERSIGTLKASISRRAVDPKKVLVRAPERPKLYNVPAWTFVKTVNVDD